MREQSPTPTGLVGPLLCVAVEAAHPAPVPGTKCGGLSGSPKRWNVGGYLQRTFFRICNVEYL